ncbi:hypothetical protein Plhal304r1_c001g0002031 [Plasmopara halstedii]
MRLVIGATALGQSCQSGHQTPQTFGLWGFLSPSQALFKAMVDLPTHYPYLSHVEMDHFTLIKPCQPLTDTRELCRLLTPPKGYKCSYVSL